MIKRRYPIQRIVSIILLLVFTAIVIINNTTQLLQIYNIPLSRETITILSALGLLASMIWTVVILDIERYK